LVERIGVALAFHLAVKFMVPAKFHSVLPGAAPSTRGGGGVGQPRLAAGIAQMPLFCSVP
jgi:hypothetical protein